jgi:hypothetical protein
MPASSFHSRSLTASESRASRGWLLCLEGTVEIPCMMIRHWLPQVLCRTSQDPPPSPGSLCFVPDKVVEGSEETASVGVSFQRGVARFEKVLTHVGLEIETLTIEGQDVGIQTEPFALELSKPAMVEAVLLPEALERFLTVRSGGALREVAVRLVPGQIHVEASTRVIFEIRATAICTFRIENGKRLYVELQSVQALGGAGAGIVQRQLDAINPILDVSELPIEVELQSVEVEEGRIVARALAGGK